MGAELGEVTFRADRSMRIFSYVGLGVVPAASVAVIVASVLDSNKTWGAVGGESFLTAVAAFVTWVVARWSATSVGTTTVRQDGLFIAVPFRRPRFVPWSQITSVSIDEIDFGARGGGRSKGLRAAVGGDGFFLPGAMASGCSTAVFNERVALVTAAWRSAHPEAGDGSGDHARRKQNNRARKRRRS